MPDTIPVPARRAKTTGRNARPRVVVTRKLLPTTESRMAELFDVYLNANDRPMSRDALAAALADADVLVPTITDPIDAALLAAAGPRLGLIANFGTGTEHIDLSAARSRRIIVTNTPGVLTDDTADMTMALIVMVSRRFGEGMLLMREGKWTGWSPSSLRPRRLPGDEQNGATSRRPRRMEQRSSTAGSLMESCRGLE